MTHSGGSERVVVVGAGIIGIACAHYLSSAGYQVTVIDKGRIAEACSQSNCGFICPSHVLPLAQPNAIRKALASVFDPKAAFRIKPRASLGFLNWLWQFAKRCSTEQMSSAGLHLKSILDSSMDEYKNLLATSQMDVQWKESGLLYVFEKPCRYREYALRSGHCWRCLSGDRLSSPNRNERDL